MPDPTHVVFVVPFALDTSLRFARAAAALADTRMSLVSQEPPERVPQDLRARLVAFERVDDAFDADQLERAVLRIQQSGPPRAQRLIGVLEQLQVPLAKVRERLGIRGMDVREAGNFRDKARMKDVLRAHGIPCARHALATAAASARAFAAEVGFPLVVKPPAGAGARSTYRVESQADLEGYLDAMPPSDSEPALLEEFITGKEHSFDSVTLHGRHLLHSVSVYTPTPLEVMRVPWIQWCVLLPRRIDVPEYADVMEIGPRALDALGMVTGITHMEWFRRSDGSLAISEVAARPPGAQFTSLLSYAHDTDFYAAWPRLMIEERFEPCQRPFSAGCAYLRGQGKGRVVGVRGASELRAELGDVLVELSLPAKGSAPSNTYEGDGFAIARHPRTEVVQAALERVLAQVRIELG